MPSSTLDQKKRALEALERRFARAKELEERNNNNKRKFIREEREEGIKGGGEQNSLDHLVANASFNRGKFKFSGNAPRQGNQKASDEQAQDPAYTELIQNIHENLVGPQRKLPCQGVSSVNKILHDLLRNGDCAQKYMHGSKSMTIENWFLLDNFVRSGPGQFTSTNARVKALQSHSKRSKKHMSMKQHKKHGSFDLPEEFHRFNLFKPINEMWKDCTAKLMKGIGRNQIPQRLLSADLHGAIMLVVECKTTELTGINGIMVRETAETFGIVTEDGKFEVVPKKGSVFILQIGNWKITLIGDKLSVRVMGPP